MTVLPQQSKCILAGSSLVGVLAEIPHQEVCLLLVIGAPKQALQSTTISSIKRMAHTQEASFKHFHKTCVNASGHAEAC